MNRLAMRAYAALSGVMLVAYYLVPPSATPVEYGAFAVLCAGAVIAFILRTKGIEGRWIWMVFAAGVSLWAIGDLMFAVLALRSTDGSEPYPSIADFFYLPSYPVLIAALLLAARRRSRKNDFVSLLDGMMVAAAASVPVGVYWIGPSLQDTQLSTFAATVSVSYPIMDLLLLAGCVRFALGTGRWTVSSVLVLAGFTCSITSDTVYNLAVLSGSYRSPSPIDIGWLVAYSLWGIAALHPDARHMLAAGKAQVGARVRTAVLGAIVVLPLGVIGAAYVESSRLNVAAVAIPVAVIAVAMTIRLRLLARGAGSAWRGPALLSGAALLIVLVAVGLTEMRAHGVEQERTANGLVSAVVLAEQLDGVAARATSDSPSTSVEAKHDWVRYTAELHRRIDTAGPALSGAERINLQRLLTNYGDAIAQELQLVQSGDRRGATSFDQNVSQPAHDALVDATLFDVARYREDAAESAHAGRIGTVVALSMTLALLCLLLLAFGGIRKNAELADERSRAVRDSELRFRALVGGSADIITVIDPDTTVIAYPESVERLLGYPAGSVLGERIDQLLGHDDQELTQVVLGALATRPNADETVAWTLRRADGSLIEAEASIVNHLDDPLLGGFVVNVRDVSDRKRLEAELEHQAFHDRLTGLANRGLIEDRLRQAFNRSVRDHGVQAMVLLDIDDFKGFNDSLGHPIGDELLRQIAGRLEDCTRSADTLARINGDAFAILIESVDASHQPMVLAERMLAALEAPFELAGGSHMVQASIGIAVSDGTRIGSAGDETAVLMRDAELAMYEAKRSDGSSIEMFASRMHEAITHRLALKDELIQALQREEFSLVYQPIVDVAERRIKGYEALVRWIHPERGFMSPADFIPIAEETGLIVDLGTWVLREACRQTALWSRSWSEPRYISVNVAGHQLARPEFVGEVQDALADAGLPAEQLLLEVTESSLIKDTEGSECRMRELRELGVSLAIDDFGTGYSSLSYLHRFSLDVLKIDKAFIDNVTDGGRGRALVDAIVNMAGSLQLRVVVEGIEEVDQVESLAQLGCGLGQGYHYSRPLPAGDVATFELEPGPGIGVPAALRFAG